MGRQSNAKWDKRVRGIQRERKVSEAMRRRALFSQHRKFGQAVMRAVARQTA